MKFKTISGSEYEVDVSAKQIRRLAGTEDPTSRQGKDGEWKSYEDIHLQVGEGAMIQWNPKTTPLLEGNIFGGVPSTLTSEVVDIERDN